MQYVGQIILMWTVDTGCQEVVFQYYGEPASGTLPYGRVSQNTPEVQNVGQVVLVAIKIPLLVSRKVFKGGQISNLTV